MMSIACEGLVLALGNDQSVSRIKIVPGSTLQNKSQRIACHFKREGVTRGEWRASCTSTNENKARLLTKPLPSVVRGIILLGEFCFVFSEVRNVGVKRSKCFLIALNTSSFLFAK